MSATVERLRLHAGNVWTAVTNRDGRRPEVLRRYAFDAARQVSPGIIASSGPRHYLVRTDDKSIGRSAFSSGDYELDVMSRALSQLNQALGRDGVAGKVFIDVGANIGTTTVPAVQHFGASRAVAIEPSPENFRLLRCNVILNDLDEQVHCVNAAITTSLGSVELELSPINHGDHRVRVAGRTQSGLFDEERRDVVTVPAMPLDHLLDELHIRAADVGLLWVDTQGHEGQVLTSATALLRQRVPAVIEYWPYGLRRASGLESLHAVITDHYTRVIDVRSGCTWSGDDMNAVEDTLTGDAYTDLVLVP